MADETAIVEYIETLDRNPGDGYPRNPCKISNAELPPNDSWFETDIAKKIKSTLTSGFMSDLTVKLQDGKVRCHSYFLGIASPKLAAMLTENQHEIQLPGVKCDTFNMLLKIIYSEACDEIKTDVGKIMDIAKIANEFKFLAAVSYCIKLLRQLLNATNVCSILDLVFLWKHLELKEACTKVIREKTDEVLKSEGFLRCNVPILEHILKQEVVHNATELGLFKATVRWANTHTNPREALGSSLGLIRFRTMNNDDIAAYVTPTKLLTESEERAFLFYLLAKGKGELPAGFSNEMRKRHTTWSVEHFSASTEKIYLVGSDWKYVTKEELAATPPLRISVNEDTLLIGVKPWSAREGKGKVEKYMEDVEVTLKDNKGTLISTATFRGEVKWWSFYDVKFPHAVVLHADVTYQLHFSHNVSGVKHQTGHCRDQVYKTDKTSLKINVLEERYSPIYYIIIAPKSV